jgi:hypothetical protein
MRLSWTDIAFQMPLELTDHVRVAWSWLLAEPWEPVLCSKIGGIFARVPSGEVLWLDTATADVEPATGGVEEFHETCRSKPDVVDEWFLPGLIQRLHQAGKVAGAGECYGFTFLPIFAEGNYTPDNMFVTSISEVFVGVAEIQKQIADVPDGSKVQIKIVD